MRNEQIKERVEELIKHVKVMLQQPNDNLQQMVVIDKLQRFGVNYHFEQEIAQALDIIKKPSLDDLDDLYMVALRFRLLRQSRYNIATSKKLYLFVFASTFLFVLVLVKLSFYISCQCSLTFKIFFLHNV